MHTDDARWSCHLQKLFSLYPLNKYSPTNRIFAGSTVFHLSLGLKEETRRKKTNWIFSFWPSSACQKSWFMIIPQVCREWHSIGVEPGCLGVSLFHHYFWGTLLVAILRASEWINSRRRFCLLLSSKHLIWLMVFSLTSNSRTGFSWGPATWTAWLPCFLCTWGASWQPGRRRGELLTGSFTAWHTSLCSHVAG